jgi:hypothetical protein
LLNDISKNLAQTQASITSARMQQALSAASKSQSDPYGLKFWDNLITNIRN